MPIKKHNKAEIIKQNIKEEEKRRAEIEKKRIMRRKEEEQKKKKEEEEKSKERNFSYYFYKDDSYGKGIENFKWNNKQNHLLKIDGADESIKLITLYPGLVVGSGYNHPKLKGENEDYQPGFFFDHTTGLPIISGSSIKGVVRSLFTDEKFGYIKDIYGREEEKKELEDRLFEDGSTIFYDAYIIATDEENKGKIFASDYITSHHSDDPMGEFKEPNPVKFLKVRSGVTFQFQFKALKEDAELIEKIILDFGLGAKTNVGYGQFDIPLSDEELENIEKEKQVELEQRMARRPNRKLKIVRKAST
ncbi:MAG TPA: type III-B CRISPR module RAMP protein Cmr6 [Sulfurovum sp.]|nr:type III-B CRISPR module RAMP protein Cmr6 [Sulfurovum sp.]